MHNAVEKIPQQNSNLRYVVDVEAEHKARQRIKLR
jgi:hypothetical protein